jgi:CheY-like chemotaxis protein
LFHRSAAFRAAEGEAVGTKRILLVDGNLDSRTVYRVLLQHRGYEVHEAEDGGSALALLERQPFDVVVTELTLKPMDGYELLSRLRAAESTRGLCVIVVTARALQEDRVRAEQAGCSLFLEKPLEPQRLLAQVEGVIP